MGTWGTSEESTRERLAVLALAAAAAEFAEEDAAAEEEAEEEAPGSEVTGLGGRA